MKFSDRIDIPPSATAVISSIAHQKRAEGETVFDLGIGEAVVMPHQSIVTAVSEAIKAGKTGYPPMAGYYSLRSKAAGWYNNMYGSDFGTDNTVITPGGKMALYMTMQVVLNPGDEVIVVTPYWVSYPAMIRLAGAVPKVIKTTEANGWKVSKQQIEAQITDKTRLILFNNGCNPTGTTYSRSQLEEIISVTKNSDLLFISDEVYSGLVYDQARYVSAAEFPEYSSNVVIIQSFSKHFALTGLRIGVLYGAKELISKLTLLLSQTTHGVVSLSQIAAEAALDNSEEIMTSVRTIMQSRRDHFYSELERIFGKALPKPAAGLYAFIKAGFFGPISDDQKLARQLIEEVNTAVVPGSAFGAAGYLRLSFGIKEQEITGGLEAIHSLAA